MPPNDYLIVGSSNDNAEGAARGTEKATKRSPEFVRNSAFSSTIFSKKALQDKPQTDKIRNWLLES